MDEQVPCHKENFDGTPGVALCGATSAYQMSINGRWCAVFSPPTEWEGVTCEGCLEHKPKETNGKED